MSSDTDQFVGERRKTRLIGSLMLAISIVVIGYVLLHGSSSVPIMLFALPIFACLGLALIIQPISKAEMLHQHGTDQMSWSRSPLLYKVFIVVGVVLSAALYYLLIGF